MKIATRMVLISQLTLLFTLLVCIFLRPSVAFDIPQGGLSNFGTEPSTSLVFSLGFWSATILLGIASSKLRGGLKAITGIYTVLLTLLILSTYPYKLNQFFETLHIIVGFGIGVFHVVSVLCLHLQHKIVGSAWYGIMLMILGFGLGLWTVFSTGLLFASQLSSGLGFGCILVNVVARTEKKGKSIEHV